MEMKENVNKLENFNFLNFIHWIEMNRAEPPVKSSRGSGKLSASHHRNGADKCWLARIRFPFADAPLQKCSISFNRPKCHTSRHAKLSASALLSHLWRENSTLRVTPKLLRNYPPLWKQSVGYGGTSTWLLRLLNTCSIPWKINIVVQKAECRMK